ncbi:MAG: hypothetical protein JRG91_14365 [Deltaproteobacteria bacterium]|nr:hypothetical protein [Deltaproteobacteria bacterium]
MLAPLQTLSCTAAALCLALGCSGASGSGPRPPAVPPEDPDPLSDFAAAAAILPPAPIAIAWADIDALRQGPVSPLLERLEGNIPAAEDSSATFLSENLDVIHRIAGGIYVTLTGPAFFIVIEGDMATETLFSDVKDWAREKGATASPCKVRGHPGLRIGNTVLVDAGDGLFINGPEGLTGRTLDLMDRKTTGSAMNAQVAYLARTTIQDDAALVVAGIAPPSITDWFHEKNLPSIVGSRFLLAVQAPGPINFRLGLLPGKPIKPIWFAQEVNTFLVRAAKDPSVVDVGMSEWVEGLHVELLNKGIVVRGSIEGDRLLEIVDSAGGGSW